MAFGVSDWGEEWTLTNNTDGSSNSIGLYNDGTDTLTDNDDIAAITTEPAGASYGRQSDTFAVSNIGGTTPATLGLDNNNQQTYDTSDSSQTVDASFGVVNFQASIASSDGSATDHRGWSASLSQSRDLSSIDTLNLDAGGTGFTLD